MITVALSATIGAPTERVWQALTDPNERVTWDDRVLGIVESVSHGANQGANRTRPRVRPSSPNRTNERRSSSVTKWRFRLGGVPLVMHDETLADEPTERRVSRISIGSMRFDQTLMLRREDDGNGPRTQLSMKLVAHNRIAVIGEVVERLDVQKIIIEYVDATLRQVQKYCEADA
ncbi:MAG: hypothetical protein ABGX04_11085 [Myxococcales bacterium]|nr:hypothetical protein [Myxococcales bacterium]HIK83516.1 hypothetical protein [Myxococcales bacterium]